MSENYWMKYREIKEAVFGDSPEANPSLYNWRHEEMIERILYLKDFYKTWLPEMQKAGWFE